MNIDELYGTDDVYAIASGWDLAEDMEYGTFEDGEYEGYYHVCNDQFVFKKLLDTSLLEENGIAENYESLKELGLTQFAIILRKYTFSWESDCEEDYDYVLEEINDCLETEFETFEEAFNYALSDDMGLSLNLAEEGETL